MRNAIKAIIAYPDNEFGEMLSRRLAAEGIAACVCREGGRLMEFIEREKPEAVIMADKGMGFDIGEFVSACHERVHKTFFIVISERGSRELEERLGSCGCVITHPVDAGQIIRIIAGPGCSGNAEERENAESFAGKMLKEAGVTVNLQGYHYLVRLMALAVEGGLPCGINEGVYEVIAGEFGRSAAGVERAVRLSIRLAYDRGNPEFMRQTFGNGAAPGNLGFIEYFSEKLRARINGENGLDVNK